jgi:hypothetical protein
MVEQTGAIVSAYLKRGRQIEDITIGSRYRHFLVDGTSETAMVVGFFYDLRGIPHVGYELLHVRPGDPSYRADRRALGLKAFCARYVEPALGWPVGGGKAGIVEKPFSEKPVGRRAAEVLQPLG